MVRFFASIVVFAWGLAHAAEPLTARDIERFIAVGQSLEALEETYPDIDIDMFGGDPQKILETIFGENGEPHIMSVLSSELASNPTVGRDFRKAVKDGGFDDVEEFGSIGDRITLTVFALNISQADLNDLRSIENLPSEAVENLPAGILEAMKRAQLFANAIDSVPQADRDTLRPYQDQIEGLGGDFGG
ncbi:MAG: hypothetical protein AAFR65_01480 [Pseudomonadota bacterium]